MSVGLDSLSLPPSPPAQEAQYAKAGAEEGECGGEWDNGGGLCGEERVIA